MEPEKGDGASGPECVPIMESRGAEVGGSRRVGRALHCKFPRFALESAQDVYLTV